MKRRTFLKTAGSLAAGASAFAILKYPRGANAAGWGAWPGDKASALLPESARAFNVLELHVNGGLSTFDTFYTVPSWGTSDYTYAHVFAPDSPGIDGFPAEANRDVRFGQCAPTEVVNEGLWVPYGASDSNGVPLYLGPWIWPLRSRPDILNRMRIVVQRHDQAAHEGANPISFTGDRLGQPRMASVGTAIQRYFTENPEVGGVRAAPYSYVLFPAGYSPFNVSAATTVGFHPGSSRPLTIAVDTNSQLYQLLQRPGLVDHTAFDNALGYYRARYEFELRKFGHSKPARSAERSNYEFADFARRHATELTSIIEPSDFNTITPPTTCGQNFSVDMPAMQARLAAKLLTLPQDAARYVMWIDAGLNPSPTGGHDVHGNSIELNGTNLPHTFQALVDIIRDPNNPSPDDAQKIDLDTTMVVINTEFGRTRNRQNDGTGTNHWPQGYVNVFIGGPVSEANGNGRSVYGHINEATAEAAEYVRPAENRMMVLQALGIYPFSSQSFAVGDVPGQGVEDELDAALRIRDTYLGYQG